MDFGLGEAQPPLVTTSRRANRAAYTHLWRRVQITIDISGGGPLRTPLPGDGVLGTFPVG